MCKWCPTLCFLSCLFRPLKIPVHMWETCFTFPFHNSTGDLWLLFLGWLTGGPGIKPVTGSEVRLTVCVIAVKDNVHYYLIVWFFVVFFFLFFFLIYSQISICACRNKQTNKQNMLTRWKQQKWQFFYVCAEV